VAIDQPTYDLLEGYHRVKWFAAGQEDLKYDTKPYFALMHKRTVLILELLKAGIKLFLCETDQVWLGDPVEYVLEHHAGADLVTYDDSKTQKDKLPCGGFLFLNPTQSTVVAWGTLVERHKKQMGNEQFLLQAILRQKPVGLKADFLPGEKFRNGIVLLQQKPVDVTGKLLIHANWMIGTAKKIAKLKEKSFWHLAADGTCKAAKAADTAEAVKIPALSNILPKAQDTFQAMSSEVLLLAQEMSRTAVSGGWVMLVLANKAFGELTQNWVCNLKRLGLEKRLQSTLFVAIDQPTYDLLEGYHRVKWFAAGQEDLKYDTKPYFALMHKRTVLILELLKAGIKLFLCETDQVWLGDPVEYVLEHHAGADLVTYDDSKTQKDKLPCGGFLFLNPTQSTVVAWGTLVERHKKQMGNEQFLLQAILRQKPVGLKADFLPGEKFRNGIVLLQQKPVDVTGKLLIHANWMTGTVKKMATLKSQGFWFVDSKDLCTPGAVSGPFFASSRSRLL